MVKYNEIYFLEIIMKAKKLLQPGNTAQGSSERVLPWQITMDQLIFASLSHTHYWYEVGMLKVPAVISRRNPPLYVPYRTLT